jgi:hypothetical protein
MISTSGFKPLNQLVSPFSESDKMPWGGAPKCPACDRNVYPMDQVIAADRQDPYSHPPFSSENAKPNLKQLSIEIDPAEIRSSFVIKKRGAEGFQKNPLKTFLVSLFNNDLSNESNFGRKQSRRTVPLNQFYFRCD